jgi:hypothetical protein
MYRKDNPRDMVFLRRSGPRYHHCGYMIQEFHHMVRACDVAGNLGFGDAIERPAAGSRMRRRSWASRSAATAPTARS